MVTYIAFLSFALRDHDGTGVEVQLTITEADLEKTDALAREHERSRSALLREAVHRILATGEDHAA